jgi:serine/threonine protein kinase
MAFFKKLFRRRNTIEDNSFTIGEILGRGGNGQVFRGTFRGVDVAIKKFVIDFHLPEEASNESSKIDREHEAMQQLDHWNILKLFHWEDRNEFRCESFFCW